VRPAWVTGIGLWTPGFDSPERWASGQPDPGETEPACAVVPARQRRGTSLVTRIGLDVMGQAATRGGADLSTACLVYGSAFGEFRTAIDQLRMMEEPEGRLSPARFKNSVHNTATGILSIAFENREPGTAISGGRSTFAMCVLEALLLLDHRGGTVVVGVADDSLEVPLCRGPAFAPLGVALCLVGEMTLGGNPFPRKGVSPGPPSPKALTDFPNFTGQLAWLERGGPNDHHSVAEELRHNPASAGLPLVEALLARRAGRVSLVPDDPDPCSVEVRFPDGDVP
jgi:hypothetical protein